jgi:hypothetical protein
MIEHRPRRRCPDLSRVAPVAVFPSAPVNKQNKQNKTKTRRRMNKNKRTFLVHAK